MVKFESESNSLMKRKSSFESFRVDLDSLILNQLQTREVEIIVDKNILNNQGTSNSISTSNTSSSL
jgi:hypothetical protein